MTMTDTYTIDLCQQGFAWADKAYAVDSAHLMAECSNAGVCNRMNVSAIICSIIVSHIDANVESHSYIRYHLQGKCKCAAGFTGAACERSTSYL